MTWQGDLKTIKNIEVPAVRNHLLQVIADQNQQTFDHACAEIRHFAEDRQDAFKRLYNSYSRTPELQDAVKLALLPESQLQSPEALELTPTLGQPLSAGNL